MAAAFGVAWVLGIAAQRLRLSPIVGYLLAGVLIGPHTPGLRADVSLASQLAEIGVVLLMFGVGLHFRVRDLREVGRLAIPGALAQSTVATLLGLGIGLAFGWPVGSGLVLGMALSVASTVVLLRGLEAHNLTTTPAGHAAIGWLIVEDILTVLVLVVIPVLGQARASGTPDGPEPSLAAGVALAIGKLLALVAVVFVLGSRLLPSALVYVARLQSRELFTLTILAIAIATAAGASALFGASMALGAFLAGMVVGQSPVSQQAAADALPLRDAFAVLFFVSVGMLFEPSLLWREPLLLLAALAVVLIGKPLAALAVVATLGYSVRTALVVALGLAQVGEFSFILGDVARQQGLLSDRGFSLLVACALVSIAVNPFLFGALDGFEGALRRSGWLWRLLNRVSAGRYAAANDATSSAIAAAAEPLAVVVGYGPVGRSVDEALRQAGTRTVVIDLNMDTVAAIRAGGRQAIFGDASHADILRQAGAQRASHLIVTLPHSVNRMPMIAAARQLNPGCRIFVRARYLRERDDLEQVGTSAVCFEEVEAAAALTSLVLADLGAQPARIEEHARRARDQAMGIR
ncbi:MAG TPA: cation:proton antiporter [Planctomycetota bacterium]|nr:cation:proton antiporter [Planctomycetota bacterium]